MKVENINGVDLTICDIVEWQEPDTKIIHSGFITPYGHPFEGYDYYIVSKSSGLIKLSDLKYKINIRKIGEIG